MIKVSRRKFLLSSAAGVLAASIPLSSEGARRLLCLPGKEALAMLHKRIPPPARPANTDEGYISAVERYLKLHLPVEIKNFYKLYGTGFFSWPGGYCDMFDWMAEPTLFLGRVSGDESDRLRCRAYPSQKDGALLIGSISGDQGSLFVRVNSSADIWSISLLNSVWRDSREKLACNFDVPMSAFALSLFSGEIWDEPCLANHIRHPRLDEVKFQQGIVIISDETKRTGLLKHSQELACQTMPLPIKVHESPMDRLMRNAGAQRFLSEQEYEKLLSIFSPQEQKFIDLWYGRCSEWQRIRFCVSSKGWAGTDCQAVGHR